MKVVVEPIRTESDYERALIEIERLNDAPAGTPDGDKVDVLLDLLEAYERRKNPAAFAAPAAQQALKETPAQVAQKPPKGHSAKDVPQEPADPVSAIRAVMKQRGMKPIDLGPILGSTPRAYEILSCKRGLSISMIRALHRELGIPLETLVGSAK
jgi:HTH-type transcriptional regulator/antitoxin HigA